MCRLQFLRIACFGESFMISLGTCLLFFRFWPYRAGSICCSYMAGGVRILSLIGLVLFRGFIRDDLLMHGCRISFWPVLLFTQNLVFYPMWLVFLACASISGAFLVLLVLFMARHDSHRGDGLWLVLSQYWIWIAANAAFSLLWYWIVLWAQGFPRLILCVIQNDW